MHITEFINFVPRLRDTEKKNLTALILLVKKLDQYSNFNVYSQTQVQCGKGC